MRWLYLCYINVLLQFTFTTAFIMQLSMCFYNRFIVFVSDIFTIVRHRFNQIVCKFQAGLYMYCLRNNGYLAVLKEPSGLFCDAHGSFEGIFFISGRVHWCTIQAQMVPLSSSLHRGFFECVVVRGPTTTQFIIQQSVWPVAFCSQLGAYSQTKHTPICSLFTRISTHFIFKMQSPCAPNINTTALSKSLTTESSSTCPGSLSSPNPREHSLATSETP